MSDKDQRSSLRKPVDLHASVAWSAAGNSIAVRTLNLSRRGTLIESSEKLLPDEVCTFKLVTDDARVIEIQGRIAWVTQESTGVYHAGVAFRNLSADEEYLLDLQIIRSGRKAN